MANSVREAQDLYERIDLGALDLEASTGNKPGESSAIFLSHGFVDTDDFEEYE